MKTKSVPLITGRTGIISKSLIKYVNNTCTAWHPGTVEKSHIGPCSYASKCTNVEVQNFYNRNNTKCTIYCNQRVRYIITTTLYKGE